MAANLDLRDDVFRHVAAAFRHLRLGPAMPPFFRDFLVRRLRPRAPALADRVAVAREEDLERLCTRLRIVQLVG
jgi:hypothetical protein